MTQQAAQTPPGSLAVIGVFTTATQAEAAVNVLMEHGLDSAHLSVLLPEWPNAAPDQNAVPAAPAHPREAKTAAGAVIGASAGGALFGSLAVLVGAGALAIPGIGPLIAAGPLLAGLAGLGVGGAVGGLGGALVAMGLQEDQAKRYVSHLGDGRTLLVVACHSAAEVGKSTAALERAGADDVSCSADTGSIVSAP